VSRTARSELRAIDFAPIIWNLCCEVVLIIVAVVVVVVVVCDRYFGPLVIIAGGLRRHPCGLPFKYSVALSNRRFQKQLHTSAHVGIFLFLLILSSSVASICLTPLWGKRTQTVEITEIVFLRGRGR